MKTTAFFLTTLFFLSLFPARAHSEPVPVYGDNSYASICYRESATASRLGSASFADLESCHKAIEYGYLTKSDLLATYVNRGILYAVLGSAGKANADYDRALALDEGVAETYLNRGNLRFMAKRYQEAIADYDKAHGLKIKPEHVLLFNRGMAYELLGELQMAEENYLASLAVVPDWEPAVDRLKRLDLLQIAPAENME